jgi:RNA recognition motif-containing protein
MNIHVSNLHLNLIESDLQRMFSNYGEVKSVELIRDKLNNRSKGRAFVEMPVEKEGLKALSQLDGIDVMGKQIQVSEVKYDPGYGSHLFSTRD